MMDIELPKMHQSQQDLDLIDILWRQDMDLGAAREVFDHRHRQKEHALRRLEEQQEAERQRLLRDQEKALLAQLQLDEETGEFVPRPAGLGQPGATPPELTQTVPYTGDDGDALSFDECMQLLADSFPLVEPLESTPVCLDLPPAPSTSHTMMAPPGEPALPQPPLLPTPPHPQRSSPDLEQAWMELLSIPELQQSLLMQMENVVEPEAYLPTNPPAGEQPPNYSFYIPSVPEGGPQQTQACPPDFISIFEEPFPNVPPLTPLAAAPLKGPELHPPFSADLFADLFCPDAEVIGHPVRPLGGGNAKAPPFTPAHPLPPVDEWESIKPDPTAEFPDSDSGVSSDASPSSGSPEKSTHHGFHGYSDSDTEEMDTNPGSVESDYADMFALTFHLDGQPPHPDSTPPAQPPEAGTEEPGEDGDHDKPPFTKDKRKRRLEGRASRDEQRAKALEIPFSVDAIINLPVDDFNEAMAKYQLSEAQLALVRDIRRRGKNKVAAQNCRKRKMASIVGLEGDMGSLREEKERLLRERSENSSSLRRVKQQLSSLYLEVFSLLRDEDGRPYSPSEYSLQQSSGGNVFLVPRVKKTLIKSDN